MEDTLRDWDVSELNSHGETVLILVLMEDTLRAEIVVSPTVGTSGLTPCFNGRYSQRNYKSSSMWSLRVLILVLMEDTLRAKRVNSLTENAKS